MRETEKDGERKIDIEREKETKNERVKTHINLTVLKKAILFF